MKKYVAMEDLNNISESQKGLLRQLWKPKKYDLITVPVCKDVENDLYDFDVYIIQDIEFHQINDDKRNTASIFPVDSYEYHEILFKAIPLNQNSLSYDLEDSLIDNSDEAEENDVVPIFLISKNDCLPLLDITGLIEILYQGKFKSEFLLKLTTNKEMISIDGIDFRSDSLIDSLWEAIKTLL